jgi:hypothetical protein
MLANEEVLNKPSLGVMTNDDKKAFYSRRRAFGGQKIPKNEIKKTKIKGFEAHGRKRHSKKCLHQGRAPL